MMETFSPNDAPDPKSNNDVDAVASDALVRSASDCDEVHQDLEMQVVPTLKADGEDQEGKFVAVQRFNQDDFVTHEVIASVEQICEVPHPLRPVNEDHKAKLMDSICAHGHDYSQGCSLSRSERLWQVTPEIELRCLPWQTSRGS